MLIFVSLKSQWLLHWSWGNCSLGENEIEARPAQVVRRKK
jgi:hypothetical protein